MNQQPKTLQTILLVAVRALVLVLRSSSLLTPNGSRLAYSDVLDLFENERVESFVLQGDTLTLTVAPKGFGSENMSQLRMLTPASGIDGVKRFVLDTVRAAGANPCPPMVLGIGIGGDFEQVAENAKRALMLPLGTPNPDPFYAQLEEELLEAINQTGIGVQGLGGRTTCLGMHIIAAPTHIAGLPVAVNVSCHVTRHATAVL